MTELKESNKELYDSILQKNNELKLLIDRFEAYKQRKTIEIQELKSRIKLTEGEIKVLIQGKNL